MTTFITEDYLRQHFGLAHGSEIQLPVDVKLTPSAQQLINERKLVVRYQDDQGRVFVKSDATNEKASVIRVHPLKMVNDKPCSNNSGSDSGSEPVVEKPAMMTHLNDKILVAKTHPRIELRGKLDSCISYCVLLQTEFETQPDFIQGFLSDIRSYLGHVLQSEVTERLLPLPYLGEFSADVYHKWSHNPLKYLGYDHIVPDRRYGHSVAKLNYLRAQVRELEIHASHVYIDQDLNETRADMIAGLNRLSSAVYVTMILLWQYESGNKTIIEGLSHAVN